MFASNLLLDYQDATPKIVETTWRLISRMRQQACQYYSYLGRQSMPCLWMAETNCHLGYQRCTAKHCWHFLDAHFHNGAVTLSFFDLPRKAASKLVMDSSDQVTFQLPYLQDYWALTLHSHSISGCERKCDAIIFDLEGSQYLLYEWLQPITT